MKREFKVSLSPHDFSATDVPSVMRNVVIALAPAMAYSFYLWGKRAALLYTVSIFFAYASEYAFIRIRKKTFINDGSALVSGLLFAMTLPPSLPLSYAAYGIIFGMVFGKHFYGGLGANIFNPALLGRAFLMAAFPAAMTSWISPLDALTTATPLGAWKFSGEIWETGKILMGNCPGSVGETSAVLLLLGGAYLLIRKIIDYRVPLFYLAAVGSISSLFYFFAGESYGSPVFHLFSGGLMLGAFFMATDPVTMPANFRGRVIFGAGCGFFTMLLRYFSGFPEGVMFSVLIMNALAPLLEKIPAKESFGENNSVKRERNR
ncbi:MAG: RnfABCDGE type electron transport complex subunit D [Candidatus Omnitrophota bacterium]|nr:RnfABCDGE type electron transport complex subunit D [Candidatus Omnitrophota bacterium]MBU3929342.1 RnfABCDGE type electron transport complex subunit D [bacterium]MBU4122457.1 RnfABCDGE type electron transport complex subunit D [bacterium]